VSDIFRSRAFYDQALAPLGIAIVKAGGSSPAGRDVFLGYGSEGKPYFFLVQSRGEARTGFLHVAFTARDRATVAAFHRAGLAAGGTDNGAPGLRHYHPHYYGAFIRDFDGHNIEAVCHEPE
jgi:catechol 2,3-dioxygenase-like lactoylglutathione lyase family enzyme